MIKTTIVGYGEAHIKGIETYIERLDVHLPTYYPAISWNICEVNLKKPQIKMLIDNLSSKVLVHNPSIVFINLSSNDMSTDSRNFIGLKAFETHLGQLLQEIRDYNNRTGLNGGIPIPIIITPTPVDESVKGIALTNNRIKQYVYVIKQVVKSYNGCTIDLFDAISSKVNWRTYIGEMGIEISQDGQDLLYDLVFIEITKLINYQGVLRDRDVVVEEFN